MHMTNSEYLSVTQLVYGFQQIHTIPNPKLYPICTKTKIPGIKRRTAHYQIIVIYLQIYKH